MAKKITDHPSEYKRWTHIGDTVMTPPWRIGYTPGGQPIWANKATVVELVGKSFVSVKYENYPNNVDWAEKELIGRF